MSTPAEILNTEIKMFPGRFTFTIARGRAEFWKSFDAISRLGDNEDGNSIPCIVEGFFACRFCKHVLKYDSKITGSSTLSRHAENCNKLRGIFQPLISSTFKKLTVLSEKQKNKIKNAELGFCVMGHQSFNSLENEGLIGLLQTFVNIASNVGCFNVKGVLFGRKTISDFSKQKVKEVKEKLIERLIEPQKADSLSITLDLWTDDYQHSSYLDVHAFWIDTDFVLQHCTLAIRHFGPNRHTAENIINAVHIILSEYNIDIQLITSTTDHGSNIVSAFNICENSARLDCMAHRFHTCWTTMWLNACAKNLELVEYDHAAAALTKYCNQASGVQEQLPKSIKKGSSTRRWQGLIDRARSIDASYDCLLQILSEPHRDRLMLIASIDRKLNSDILTFMDPFGKLFEILQSSTIPTINYAVLVYYKAVAFSQPSECDSQEIATLKKELIIHLNVKYFEGSLKAHHWMSTFLDPMFKRFDFLPNITYADRLFKAQLLVDLELWIMSQMDNIVNRTSFDQRSEPTNKRQCVSAGNEHIFSDLRDGATSGVSVTENSPYPQQEQCRQEFEDYKTMSPALSNITGDNNPLLFWRDTQRRFPILSQLAKMLFAAQCSSAQSERDFSSCGLTLTERRTLLSPETVEALEILYSAEKHTKEKLFD